MSPFLVAVYPVLSLNAPHLPFHTLISNITNNGNGRSFYWNHHCLAHVLYGKIILSQFPTTRNQNRTNLNLKYYSLCVRCAVSAEIQIVYQFSLGLSDCVEIYVYTILCFCLGANSYICNCNMVAMLDHPGTCCTYIVNIGSYRTYS